MVYFQESLHFNWRGTKQIRHFSFIDSHFINPRVDETRLLYTDCTGFPSVEDKQNKVRVVHSQFSSG